MPSTPPSLLESAPAHQITQKWDVSPNSSPLEHSRSYQIEMFEASMKANIIIVMDTGSGKTHVAIIRIKAELETCLPQQLIWFLAPTVALCEQQHKVLSESLPAVQIRLLVGSDNVDHWSEQRIWDMILDNFKIIVSTHAVLADALDHGFITMERLALLVFDEAHHCARGHPANKIMTNHYHPSLSNKGKSGVPSVLGLTASPIIRSKASDLDIIERNLNATCKTPRVHRQELLEHVHRPQFIRLIYTPMTDIGAPSALSRLKAVCNATKVCGSQVTANSLHESRRRGNFTKRTNEVDQLKRFCAKALHVNEELGSWAAEYYIHESIQIFKDALTSKPYAPSRTVDENDDLLLQKLQHVCSNECSKDLLSVSSEMAISEKVEQLIQFLISHDKSQRYGIVFVEQRATVAVLDKLLSNHPITRSTINCSTFVGSSGNASRKTSLGEWLDSSQQQDTLKSFRVREKNLIIATSVLEEGIDISACNMVICFNKPANLKSFIQRRGRARKAESTFVLMLSSEDTSLGHSKWAALEMEMMEAYQKDAAERRKAQLLEDIEEFSDSRFKIESTRALLTFDTAAAHIYHFCATLPLQPYVDMRPLFEFREDVKTKLITATVTLPNCVDPSVRKASSRQHWKTEKMALKDAAFEAYIALYRKGLVNDHLLPLLGCDEDIPTDVEGRQAFCEVSEIYDPWIMIAQEWTNQNNLYRKVVSIERPGHHALSIDMILPKRFAPFGPFPLYWDEKTTFTVSMYDLPLITAIDPLLLSRMRLVTSTILRSVHSKRMISERDDFVVLFGPSIDQTDLGAWLDTNAGHRPSSDLRDMPLEHRHRLIRAPSLYGALYLLKNLGPNDTLNTVALPKRRNFLHYERPDRQKKNESTSEQKKGTFQIVPIQSSTVDKLSLVFVEWSLIIPSILHQLWRHLLALDLTNSLFPDPDSISVEYIITATNAPSSGEATNYQQLEFFGDSVLKYLAAIHLYHNHKAWPEGYLSKAKDNIVSNSRLSRAGVEANLDRYIVTKQFTAKKWTPAYISDYPQPVVIEKREMSTKVIADVVEALVGAAFLAGGLQKAVVCVSRLLPEIPATVLDIGLLPDREDLKLLSENCFPGLESFLGHKFSHSRLLKEGLTHPSCQNDANTLSYQRLEFVGDAALDMLIISYLAEHAPDLPPGRLTLIKAAMVNAGFLAYLCQKTVVQQEVVDISSLQEKFRDKFTFEEQRSSRSVTLSRFMQHHHAEINVALEECDSKFERLRPDIEACLKNGTCYPWALLTSLAHEKFVSDIIESLFGAILIDAGCDIQACYSFAENLGLFDYLRRIVKEDIDLRHPKNILGEIANGRTVEYEVGIQKESDGYFCTVKLGGIEVVKASNGSSRDEVITRAADEAIKLVKE